MSDTKDQVLELDRRILALTEERFGLQFRGPFSQSQQQKWMSLQEQIDKLVEERKRIQEDHEHVHA